MKNKKILINSGFALLIVGLIYWFVSNFAPGSYPYAEEYEINVNESKLIECVMEFKKQNPEYEVPRITINNKDNGSLEDGRSTDKNDHWYHLYFYYPKENQIIYTWLRQSDNEKTTFALVSVNQGLELGNWKDINKDFGYLENKREKEKFEDLILNKIKKQLMNK